MNAQQLKNAILQEAIEGRLVPQDPNDEPASVLLQRIREQKEKLVKEGKLKKKDLDVKPISEDEKPFEIPEGWEWCRLGEIITYQNGYSYNSSETNKEKKGLPVIKSGNIMTLEVVIKPTNDYVENPSSKMMASKIIKGDMLMCLSSQSDNPEPLGKTAIYKIDSCALLNQRVLKFRPLNAEFTSYLYFAINSFYFWYNVSHQGGGSAQANLKLYHVLDMLIPLPPLSEQKRIVAKIEELLPKVEEYGKAQEALDKLNAELPERLRKSILQEAIEGRLVAQDPNDEPASVLLQRIRKEKEQLVKEGKLKKKDLDVKPISEDEIPFEIPEGWEWVKAFDCIDILYGYPFDSQKFREERVGFPLIRIRDILPSETNTYTTEVADERYIIKKGDMLVGMDGNFNVRFWNSEDAYLNQRVCKIKTKDDLLSQKFFYYYLPYALDEIFKKVSYVTVKHLSDKHFRSMLLPLPPLSEQHRIVERLEQLLGKIDKL